MMKAFEWITEVIGWLQIVASPFLMGLVIGSIIYFPNPTAQRLLIGISFSLLGLVIGILWATKVWKTKEGTISFLSRTMATPELDNIESESAKETAGEKKGNS
jgi:hypothetical protein